jgi:hypothetical protein
MKNVFFLFIFQFKQITMANLTTIVNEVLDQIKENVIDTLLINEQMNKLNVDNDACSVLELKF